MIAGTVCAYPKLTPVPFREDDLWNGYPEETNAPYGVAKKALLVGAQAYREQYGLDAIFLLPVNLYGPRDNFDLDERRTSSPHLIRKMLEPERRREVVLWGDGSPTREFLYVDDCAEALVLAAERYDGAEPVNLGTGGEIAIRELAELDRRADRLHGRDPLGRVDAERPAAPQPRHVARRGAVRLPRADAAPRGPRADGRVVPQRAAGSCGQHELNAHTADAHHLRPARGHRVEQSRAGTLRAESVAHRYDFGDERGLVGAALTNAASWDALRSTEGPFGLPRSHEEWARRAQASRPAGKAWQHSWSVGGGHDPSRHTAWARRCWSSASTRAIRSSS